ncbi:MAG: hypothetical protein V2A61_06025, partial [Calditrichota bacterium]
MRSAIFTLIAVLTAASVYADIINVPEDVETIQGGIDAAEEGDTVLVAPGEYVENVDFQGKAIIVMGSPDDPGETVIDGGGNGR